MTSSTSHSDSAIQLHNLRPVKTRRTFEDVTEQLRGAIASGDLKLGDRLPGERILAEQLLVSRAVVREALRMLESAGLIELRKGRSGGAVVCEGSTGGITQSIQDLILLGSMPLTDLTEARIDITNAVIAHFCSRATEKDYASLEENVELTQKIIKEDLPANALIDASIAFHRILAAGTNNKLYIAIIDATTAALRDFLAIGARYPKTKLILSRRRLLKHLRAGDVGAAQREMTKNLLELHNRIWAKLHANPPDSE